MKQESAELVEWIDLATRAGGTAGLLVLLIYGFGQVRSRDGEWREIIDAKDSLLRTKVEEIDRLERIAADRRDEIDRLRDRVWELEHDARPG